MKYRNAVMCMVVGLLVAGGTPGPARAQFAEILTLKEALKQSLQSRGAKTLLKREIVLDKDMKTDLAKLYSIEAAERYLMYTGLDKEKDPVGTAIIVDIAGKEGPLQMVVCVEPDSGRVYNLGFTLFGEERGMPVAEASYLKQYIGADASKAFVLGKDVDAISGATRTSSAVAVGVKIAVSIYDYLVIQGKGKGEDSR